MGNSHQLTYLKSLLASDWLLKSDITFNKWRSLVNTPSFMWMEQQNIKTAGNTLNKAASFIAGSLAWPCCHFRQIINLFSTHWHQCSLGKRESVDAVIVIEFWPRFGRPESADTSKVSCEWLSKPCLTELCWSALHSWSLSFNLPWSQAVKIRCFHKLFHCAPRRQVFSKLNVCAFYTMLTK